MNDVVDETALRRRLARTFRKDAWRVQLLEAVRRAAPDAWLTGGFVRGCVWDEIFDSPPHRLDDVDVVLYRPGRQGTEHERNVAALLAREFPDVPWSVRNQARMHARSGDLPYESLEEAIRLFPDTASAVAVRLARDDSIEVLAPYGLADLYAGVVRPTEATRAAGSGRYASFVARKRAEWIKNWPQLQIEPAEK